MIDTSITTGYAGVQFFCGRVKGTSEVSNQFADDFVGGEEVVFGDADAGALPLKSSFAQKGVNNSAVCQ